MDMTNNQGVVIVLCLPQCTVNCKAKKNQAAKKTYQNNRAGVQTKLKKIKNLPFGA